MEVVDEAVGEDNFEVAKRAGRLANQLARLSKDRELVQEIAAKGKQVIAAAKAYADAQEAMATLKDNPDDPDANLIVGKYVCFSKGGDWKNGLSMLSKGSDENLKALAAKDIAGGDSPVEQMKLGDAWKAVAKERAAYWYKQALPGLAGLEREKVEKNLLASAKTVYLSELQAQEVRAIDSIHISVTVNGKPSPYSLNAHPVADKSSSHIAYQLDKSFHTFRGNVGVRSGAGPASSLTFRIVGDGRLLWQSRPIQAPDTPQAFRVNISSVKKLELFVDCSGSYYSCQAIWIVPVVTK